ncbi:sterol 3-beta-glucosyltransferase [Scheffersomyces amazonensis]|uniref:sterol 3-beta-glucosyltransferase n=1 Tax=Scheffersomyces amazonensis TaxID=1078765 RepID=UPI00315D0012
MCSGIGLLAKLKNNNEKDDENLVDKVPKPINESEYGIYNSDEDADIEDEDDEDEEIYVEDFDTDATEDDDSYFNGTPIRYLNVNANDPSPSKPNEVSESTEIEPSESESYDDDTKYTLHPFNPDRQAAGKPLELPPVHEPQPKIKRTTLQQSFLDNLNPHLIKEGFLLKLKDGQDIPNVQDEIFKARKDKLCLDIAEKLQNVFELNDDDYFHGHFNTWLIKDVLLQGHLYLTKQCIFFFAFLPKKVMYTSDIGIDDSQNIVQSGSLGLKSAKYVESVFTTIITHKFWAILRSETLSIYSSSTDLYFPSLVIDLRTCIRAEIIDKEKIENIKSPGTRSRADTMGSGYSTPKIGAGTNNSGDTILSEDDIQSVLAREGIEENVEGLTEGVWFKLVTEKKSYRFCCDNLYSARQWCNNLTKQIFQLNNSNENNEVLIKIPIENVMNYGRNELFEPGDDDSEQPISLSLNYLRNDVKAKKSSLKKRKNSVESVNLESLYFMFFHEGNEAFEAISKVINDYKTQERDSYDIDDAASLIIPLSEDKFESTPLDRSDSRLKKIGRTITNPTKIFSSRKSSDSHQSTISSIATSLFDDVTFPFTDSHTSNRVNMPRPLSFKGLKNLQMSFETSHINFDDAESMYRARSQISDSSSDISFPGPLNLTDPSKYKKKSSNSMQNKILKNSIGKSIKVISNVGSKWTAPIGHFIKISENDSNYVKDSSIRQESQEHFIKHFSLNSEKKLIATYYCHLIRTLPVYGKLYIGQTEICFRSLLPGVSTKMILPLTDIETCYKEKSAKLTYYGLVIMIKGRQKLFLEFSSQKPRDDCEEVMLKQLEAFHEDEVWSPTPIQWGNNYDLELNRVRLSSNDGITSPVEQRVIDANKKIAYSKIDNARLKMFEDRINAASGLDIPLILEDSPFIKIEIKPSTSYKFTFLTIGSRGDVQPYIALGKGLINEGHVVTIATHKEFEPWIRKHGMDFKEIAGDPGELMSLMVTHGSMSVSFLREASAKFRSWITELLSSSWEACQGADILIESPSAMGGVHIAEALGIPYMRAFTMPWTRTRAYPHAFIVPDQKKGGSYNYLTHVMFETVFWKGISSQINKWRVKELDLPRTNLMRMQQTKIPFLYNVSPSIFPPSVDFSDWVKVTGYWFLDEGAAEQYDPPEALLNFMADANESGKKIVYIGFGSIVVKDAKSLTKAVVEAVLNADVRCILNKGWSDRLSTNKDEPEIELPPEVYNSGAIPHDWLFPRIDAAVHHGGSGTTGATLRWGVPTIIKPFFGDQFFYASRVEELGVGISLKKLNSRSLAKALDNAVSDLNMIEKCKRLSEKIQTENGVLSAIEVIYSEMEYARSLITAKQQYNEMYKLHHPDFRSSGLQTPMATDYDDEEYEDEADDDEDDEDEEDEEDDEDDEIDDVTSEEADFTIADNTIDEVDNRIPTPSLGA